MSGMLKRLLVPAAGMSLVGSALLLQAEGPVTENREVAYGSGNVTIRTTRDYYIELQKSRLRMIGGRQFIGGFVPVSRAESVKADAIGNWIWVPLDDIAR